MSLRAYAAATRIAAPGLRVMLRRRVAAGKEIAARLPERRGVDPTPRPDGDLLWLHAASVGEAVSVLPVLSALDPSVSVLFTTGTVSSARLLERRLPELGLGDRVRHRFVPLDVPGWAARFLDHWRPDAACFVESEIWPNLLAACRARGVRLALVNARLSARSAAGWARAPGLARALLGGFDLVQAQSVADAARLRALGAREADAPGNLKFAAPALPADSDELARLRVVLDGRPVWLAASTHPGEEEIAARVHHALAPSHPGLVTIVAPRHPERGAAIAAGLGGAPRRAAGEGPPPGGIWIADTLGELGLLFRLGNLAFLGGSLSVPGGGHNVLEAARLGCAVAVGPRTGNFADAVAVLEAAGGLARVTDADALAAWVGAMLDDPARCAAAADAARRAASRTAELPARTAARLLALVQGGR